MYNMDKTITSIYLLAMVFQGAMLAQDRSQVMRIAQLEKGISYKIEWAKRGSVSASQYELTSSA